MKLKLNVFISYSRKDLRWKEKLLTHLSILKRQEYINTWSDDLDIEAGSEWKYEIDKAINSADIILLLISADFIASEYCYNVEMKRAIERHNKGEAIVIPILLRHCSWEKAPFGKIQALPTNGKPITDKFWHKQDLCFHNITNSLKDLIEKQVFSQQANYNSITIEIKNVTDKLLDLESIAKELNNANINKRRQNTLLENQILENKVKLAEYESDTLEILAKKSFLEKEKLTLESNKKSSMNILKQLEIKLNKVLSESDSIQTYISKLRIEIENLEQEKIELGEDLNNIEETIVLQQSLLNVENIDRIYKNKIRSLKKKLNNKA